MGDCTVTTYTVKFDNNRESKTALSLLESRDKEIEIGWCTNSVCLLTMSAPSKQI